MQTGKARAQVGATNEAISVGKVRVKPRDIVIADANGVVIGPRIRDLDVASVVTKIEKNESRTLELMVGCDAFEGTRKAPMPHVTTQREKPSIETLVLYNQFNAT